MRLRRSAAQRVFATAPDATARNVVTHVSIDPSYRSTSVRLGTSGGVRVEIYGLRRSHARAVLRQLRLPGWFPRRSFTRVKFNPNDDERDRIVLVFGPAPRNDDRACKGMPSRGAVARGSGAYDEVTAYYCDGFEAEARATLSSSHIDAPRSKGFRDGMALLLRKTLPRRNPERDTGRCRKRFGVSC